MFTSGTALQNVVKRIDHNSNYCTLVGQGISMMPTLF